MAEAMTVVFHKGATRRYRSVLRRPDGVDVELEGGGYNDVGGPAREVPHDIAHLVVEDELGLTSGVWGVLARGGMFRNARVVAGRQRPHAAQRARTIAKEAAEELTRAEMLVGAVCDLAARDVVDERALRAGLGERWWTETATRNALTRATGRLRDAGEAWARLEPGETVHFAWG